MNYIKHLTGFFDRIIQDPSLNPTHISLYIALFQFWNINRFQNPISITREEVMHISKICSKATYHKCMRELNEKKYIKYMPSFNPFKGSMVILINLSEDSKPVQKKVPKNEQALNRQETSSEIGTEQALVPSINYINKTNNLNSSNLNEQPQNFKIHQALSNFAEIKIEKEFHITSNVPPQSCHPEHVTSPVSPRAQSRGKKPTLDKIKNYFNENNFPELEAQKFFNHFSSNGWLVGGKTPMVDWQSASQNWMLNANKFNSNENPNRAKHLNTPTDKNYAEPL